MLVVGLLRVKPKSKRRDGCFVVRTGNGCGSPVRVRTRNEKTWGPPDEASDLLPAFPVIERPH